MAYQPHKFIDLQISTFRGVAEDIDIPLLSKNPTDVIKAGDEILCCLELDTEGTIATCADVTANVSVSRNGYITTRHRHRISGGGFYSGIGLTTRIPATG